MKKNLIKTIILLLVMTLFCVCLSACGEKKTGDKEYFSEQTTYYLTTGEAVDMDITGYLDREKTTLEFYPDGTMCLTLTPNEALLAAASMYLYVNRENLAGISLSDLERYTGEVLPGESFFDIMSALMKLGNSLGLKVNGIDYEDEEVQKVLEKFEETHEIPTFAIPMDLNITIEAPYALCEVPSVTRSEPFDAIYLGDYDSIDDDPFIVMTRYIDSKGKEAIFLSNEMLSLRVDFSMK